jgi:carboxyl-terminal processing protease
MRRFYFTVLFLLLSCIGYTQTLQEKLFYTCKIWGVVKYYHSNVSTCGVNWDSVLVDKLPAIRSASTFDEFNNLLMEMLSAAGPMALSSVYFPDTLSTDLKRNRDFNWFSDPLLRSDVTTILDTIKNNFRPHANCWVELNSGSSPTAGWLLFPYDSIMLNLNTISGYPGVDERLLMLFKYWNIIRYFNPYNYVSDNNWEDVLYNYVVPATTVTTAKDLYLLLEKMSARVDDAHAEGLTYSSNFSQPPGIYKPKLRLKYLDGNYRVIKSGIAGIDPGDIIASIDGRTVGYWEDSLRPYTSAGNEAVFRRFICESILRRESSSVPVALVIRDASGTDHSFSLNGVSPGSATSFFYDKVYFTDSITTVKWTTLNCDIGYVNMGNLALADADAMYAALKSKNAIIFDLRYGANGTALKIADLMFPGKIDFAKFQIPDETYPGTYYWQVQSAGVNGNPEPYTGKVILLFDENTQSHLEWSCMVLGSHPNAIKVGSQTAGADGNVCRMRFSIDGYTGFTTCGAFYANGDSTQRIGIVPDTVINQTSASVRTNRDRVLEKALTVGGCEDFLFQRDIRDDHFKVTVYPNPANQHINISLDEIDTENADIEIIDVYGQVKMRRKIDGIDQRYQFNLSQLAPGVYIVKVNSDCGTLQAKFTKI